VVEPVGATTTIVLVGCGGDGFINVYSVGLAQVGYRRGDLQVESAVIYLTDFGVGVASQVNDGLHDVDVLSALEWSELRGVKFDCSASASKKSLKRGKPP
jgi:hypothetical protein